MTQTVEQGKAFTLKALLTIIFGSILLPYMTILQFSNAPIFFPELLNTLLYYNTMVLCLVFSVLKKHVPAILLASIVILCKFLMPVMSSWYMSYYFPHLSYPLVRASTWTSWLPSLVLNVFLLFYAIFGIRHRDSLLWLLLYLGLYIIVLVIGRNEHPIVFLLNLSFFGIGYSPEKWYRRKKPGTESALQNQ